VRPEVLGNSLCDKAVLFPLQFNPISSATPNFWCQSSLTLSQSHVLQ